MSTKNRLNQMLTFECAFCGAANEVECDAADKRRFTLTEDCWVCCRPNLVRVTYDEESGELTAVADEDT